jgi:hypothetical protein
MRHQPPDRPVGRAEPPDQPVPHLCQAVSALLFAFLNSPFNEKKYNHPSLRDLPGFPFGNQSLIGARHFPLTQGVVKGRLVVTRDTLRSCRCGLRVVGGRKAVGHRQRLLNSTVHGSSGGILASAEPRQMPGTFFPVGRPIPIVTEGGRPIPE